MPAPEPPRPEPYEERLIDAAVEICSRIPLYAARRNMVDILTGLFKSADPSFDSKWFRQRCDAVGPLEQ